MSIKVEKNVKIPTLQKEHRPRYEFLMALRSLKPGESFLYELSSYDRTSIGVAQTLLDRRFITRKEPDGKASRIFRTA